MTRHVSHFVCRWLLLALLSMQPVLAYEIDPSFPNPVIESLGGEVRSLLVDSAERIVAAGKFSSWDSETRHSIVRLMSNGAVDPGFRPLFDGSIAKILSTANGYLVVGNFERVNDTPVDGIVALTFNGTIDTSFQSAIRGEIKDALRLANGNILLAGRVFALNNLAVDVKMVQLLNDGSIASGFNPDFANGSNITAVAEAGNGDIIAAGSTINVGDQTFKGVVRLKPNGDVDTGFSSPIPNAISVVVEDVLVQQDNKVILAGFFSSFVAEEDNRVIRLNSDGSLDTSYDLVAKGNANALYQLGNNVLVGGEFVQINNAQASSPNLITLAMIDGSGASVPQFSMKIDSSRTLAISQQQSGKIITAGTYVSRFLRLPATSLLRRLETNGAIDSSFGERGRMNTLDTFSAIRKVFVQSDNSILLFGQLSRVNEVDVDNIVRLTPNGAVDQSFRIDLTLTDDPDTRVSTLNGLQIDDKAILQVSRGNQRAYVRLLRSGQIDRSFADNGFLEAATLFGVSQRSFYTSSPESGNSTIIRRNLNGEVDQNFSPIVVNDGFVSQVVELQSGRLIITGRFTALNGVAKPGIAAVDATGKVLDSFSISVSNEATNFPIVPLNNNKFVWRNGTNIVITDSSGDERTGIGVTDSSGEHDLNFSFDEVSDSFGIGGQCDNKVWVAGRSAQDSAKRALLRYNQNGELDSTIGDQSPLIEASSVLIRLIEDLPDGRIVVAGQERVSKPSGQEQRAFLRLIRDVGNENAACYRQNEELCVVIPKGAVFCL